MTAETTVFVPQHHGGTRATNVKQTKTRGTSMLHTRMHTLVDFLLDRHGNKTAIVEACLCWKRTEGQICKQTMQLCACVPSHACMPASYTDRRNGSRQTVAGTITVNTDGRRGKWVAL